MDRRIAWVFGLVIVSACSSSGSKPDSGVDQAAACAVACDDGLFCNGTETCDPENAAADENGCVDGSAPCAVCDEAADMCNSACTVPDGDGDGVASVACGGNDCDDNDPGAFPGNTEVCDEDDRDEDCDPVTLGTDADGDGEYDEDCCNGSTCGQDCNDDLAGVNPDAVDGCGGGDEDCDGDVDEEPDSTYFRDQDNDDWGDDTETLDACSQPSGYVPRGGDCSDDPFAESNANDRNPGVDEICNLIDDNCDLAVDEGLECDCTVPNMVRDCGFDPALDNIGICRLGTQMCRPEGSYTMCAGAIPPIDELCNLADDDCDMMVDEGARTRCWQDPDRDGFAAVGASFTDECTCPDATTSTDPAVSADCGPSDMTIYPGAPEICNRVDDDCSRAGAAETGEDADNDGYTATAYTQCTGGFPKTDCFDSDSRVHPGATYQGSPYCPGLCRCNNGCSMPSFPQGCAALTCLPGTGDGPLPGSYDFNCDGVTTREPVGSSCVCQPGFACNGDSPTYTGTPACGSNVTYRHCGDGECGACGGGPNTTERLRCY